MAFFMTIKNDYTKRLRTGNEPPNVQIEETPRWRQSAVWLRVLP
jgi:hypothetical protein